MWGCIYGLTRCLTVLYDLLYYFTRTGHPCQFFKIFKNHTWLSRIYSNGPSVTWIRSRLVRLYVRFTRMANRISRVFCVRQALPITMMLNGYQTHNMFLCSKCICMFITCFTKIVTKCLVTQADTALDSKPIKPVSHRTRLGTRFHYGILCYTRVDWYEY